MTKCGTISKMQELHFIRWQIQISANITIQPMLCGTVKLFKTGSKSSQGRMRKEKRDLVITLAAQLTALCGNEPLRSPAIF